MVSQTDVGWPKTRGTHTTSGLHALPVRLGGPEDTDEGLPRAGLLSVGTLTVGTARTSTKETAKRPPHHVSVLVASRIGSARRQTRKVVGTCRSERPTPRPEVGPCSSTPLAHRLTCDTASNATAIRLEVDRPAAKTRRTVTRINATAATTIPP